MNVEHPHEIRRFADGEPVPDHFMPLTEAEVAELEALTSDERGHWLEARHRRELEAIQAEKARAHGLARERIGTRGGAAPWAKAAAKAAKAKRRKAEKARRRARRSAR